LQDAGIHEARIGLTRMGDLPLKVFEGLKTALPHAEFVDVSTIFDELRAIKSPAEIALLRQSARLVDLMLETLRDIAQEGTPRYQAMAKMEYAARSAEADHAATWMTTGPLGGPYLTNECVQNLGAFKRGDMIACGTYAFRRNYWGHELRMGVIGRPSREQEAQFTIVQAAQDAAVKAARPGNTVGDLYAAANAVFDQSGVGEASKLPFRLVHGIGLSYQEQPLDLNMVLKPGMTFHIHPSMWGGGKREMWVAVGDTFLVNATGVERLTKFPQGLFP
jgi:Xaa-Pro dipeptidase